MNTSKECPQFDCGKKDKCCEMFRKVVIPAAMGDDSPTSPAAPANGAYHNALVEYEENGALYMYSSDGIYTKLYYTTDELSGMASVGYVNAQDGLTLQSAKDYADSLVPPIATTDTLGLVKIGDRISVAADGTISADGPPIATGDSLGMVQIGNNLSIDQDGVLSADPQGITIDDALSPTSTNPVQNKVINDALGTKADSSAIPTKTSELVNDSGYITSSSLPAVNDATLTIQQNGTNVATFTANADTAVTANISVPVFTLTTTDPGEGVALADGNFIGVYQ